MTNENSRPHKRFIKVEKFIKVEEESSIIKTTAILKLDYYF